MTVVHSGMHTPMIYYCHFVLVLFNFAVLGFASLVPSQQIAWEERL